MSAHRGRRRSTVALAGVAAVALLAGACSSGDDEASDGSGDGGAAAGIECPVDALESADGPVEVVMWHSDIGLPKITLEKLAQQYNDSQDKVVVQTEYQGTFEEQVKKYEDAMADPGSLPDIVAPDDTSTQFMADSGTVIPAAACIEADPDAAALYDDLQPIFTAAYSIDDTLWPASASAAGASMYVNEKHFTDAGLDPASLPGTLDELRATAEAIKAANIPGLETPMVFRIEAWPLEFWTSGAEQAVVNNDNGRSALATTSEYANDTTLEIYEWLIGMEADGLMRIFDTADVISPFLAVANQTASILIDTSAAISTVNGAIEGTLTGEQIGEEELGDLSGFVFPDLKVGVGGMPGLDAPGKGQMGGAAWYVVNGEDPEKIAAVWDFIKWFNQPEQQVTWAIESSYFPLNMTAAEDPRLQAYWTDTRPGRWMAIAYDAFENLDTNFPGPVIGPYKQFREAVRRALADILLEGGDPADAMATVDEKLQEELDAYALDVQG